MGQLRLIFPQGQSEYMLNTVMVIRFTSSLILIPLLQIHIQHIDFSKTQFVFYFIFYYYKKMFT